MGSGSEMALLVYASLLNLVISIWLPKRKLVDAEDLAVEGAAEGGHKLL